jgi:hypothetical protein
MLYQKEEPPERVGRRFIRWVIGDGRMDVGKRS